MFENEASAYNAGGLPHNMTLNKKIQSKRIDWTSKNVVPHGIELFLYSADFQVFKNK